MWKPRATGDETLLCACEINDYESALNAIKMGATNFDEGLVEACRGGHEKLVHLMIEKGAKNFHKGLIQACFFGYEKLALLMIKKGATNFNEGLDYACNGGNEKLVHLMIEKGAINFDSGLINACYGAHEKLVSLMIKMGATDLNRGLRYVHSYQKKIALFMIEKGADINQCTFEITDIHLEYLLCKRITNFGKYKKRAKIVSRHMSVRKQIFSATICSGMANDVAKY